MRPFRSVSVMNGNFGPNRKFFPPRVSNAQLRLFPSDSCGDMTQENLGYVHTAWCKRVWGCVNSFSRVWQTDRRTERFYRAMKSLSTKGIVISSQFCWTWFSGSENFFVNVHKCIYTFRKECFFFFFFFFFFVVVVVDSALCNASSEPRDEILLPIWNCRCSAFGPKRR